MTNLTVKDKIIVTIETLRKYNLNGSESIINSLSLMLRGMEEVENETDMLPRNHFHLIIKNRNNFVISSPNNKDTFCSAIMNAGLRNVYELKLYCGSFPLLTDLVPPRHRKRYHSVGDGLYMRKVVAATTMKPILETISERLSLGWTIMLK